MYISQMEIKNFRNLETANIELIDGINIFYGNNGQGKTNFLESIYLTSTGRSHRTNIDSELIAFDKDEAFINGIVKNNEYTDKISIYLRRNRAKGIAINNIPLKKVGDLFGRLYVVIFSPEDLQLVKSGPSERRKFLDTEICQLSNVYYYELNNYYRVLRQRNNLLKDLQKNKDKELKDTVFIWDKQLVEHGIKIYNHRKDFIERLNIIAGDIYGNIVSHTEELEIKYNPNIIPEEFEERLKKGLERDIRLGSTYYGIHKDDMDFIIDDMDLRKYGSQGQQRTASLSAKLAEIDIIHNKKGVKPVLLLDDVLSELDKNRQFFLISKLKDIQTIITCTGVEDLLNQIKDFESVKVFNVDDGKIKKIKK